MSVWQYVAVLVAMTEDNDGKSLTADEKEELWEWIRPT
jgi:hypothetical protein